MKFGIWINPRILSSSTFNSQVIVFLCENVKRDDRNQIVARKEKRENGGFWLVKESESEIPIRLYPADPMTRISSEQKSSHYYVWFYLYYFYDSSFSPINGPGRPDWQIYTVRLIFWLYKKMGENSEIVLIEGERLFPFQL